MTNKEILEIAMKQSAVDMSCELKDFLGSENKVVISQENQNARKYFKLPFFCNLVSYGTNIVASVNEEIKEIVEKYINNYKIEYCFGTPNLYALNQELQRSGHDVSVCFMGDYFLPDVNKLKDLACNYETKVLTQIDFANLYTPEWSNALCEQRKNLDVLGVGAYDNGKLIGLAACSADCEDMWQIGIDVLPEYRRNGIAASLTSKLALEVLSRGKVPFYGAAWSNIKSVRNSIKCGFKPAWVEATVKSNQFVEKMIKVD